MTVVFLVVLFSGILSPEKLQEVQSAADFVIRLDRGVEV